MPLARRVTVEAPHINFACSADEDVMLNPVVFRNACRLLQIHPTADMFASSDHYQILRYYAYANYALLCIIMHFYATWKKTKKRGRFCIFTQKNIM